MEKIHSCKENTYDDVRIVFDKINVEKAAWFCEQTWHASKFDVEEGEAEEVGNAISTHIFLITYCPFCGENLNGA